MVSFNSHPAGRHFLQIPGPTNVPDTVLRAIDYPTIDHRGPEFAQLGLKVLADIKPVFQTRQPVIIYPASGTGAWEAALVNTLSAGDAVLMSPACASFEMFDNYGHRAQVFCDAVQALALDEGVTL